MIEMLTVIAIIAILAGILFPVFATVRRNVHKTTCMSNLHQIGVALKLYKDEHNGAYPEALYGYVTPGANGQAGQQVLGLYPQYLNNQAIFRCPLSPYQLNNGQTLQGNLPDSQWVTNPFRLYPAWDSYDGQVEPNKVGNPYYVKYTRHWSRQRPGFSDNPRQLLYKNPPDDTVVTWCTYHRDYTAGSAVPQTGSLDLVLYLDGHVKPVPSDRMAPMMINNVIPLGHSYLVGQS
jgi:type II secretory pathway pseudopilin PulG